MIEELLSTTHWMVRQKAAAASLRQAAPPQIEREG
jgi:hypothetical protein